jgi:iron complex outermembrane recepter protein
VRCGITLAGVLGSISVCAQAEQFNIPSEKASKSIPELARQADVQIIGPGEPLQNVITPEIKGTFDVIAALEMMLQGTDLTVSRSAGGVVTISSKKKNCNDEGETMSQKSGTATSAVALLLSAFAAPACHAQAAPAPDTGTVETVVVTGTLIRGVEKPTGSNLVSIGVEDVKASGVTTALDLLNQMVPQLSSFNTLQTGSSNAGGAVTKVALRGYVNSGATGTLILFNGHRVVPMGILSTEPDPDLIPADVIQSIQVMPDGGSATYGADAVGGVVNFITRTSFDGIQVHAQDSFADSYNEFNISLTGGTSWNGGNALISVLHDDHDALFGRDRDYDTTDFTSHGGLDYRSARCGYGTFSVGGKTYIGPDFSTVSAAPKCDPTDNSSIYPSESRNSVFGYVEQNLTDSLKFSVDAYWSKRKTDVYTDMNSLTSTLTINSSNPYWHPVGTETSQSVGFSFVRALGATRVTPQDFTQYQITPVLTWDVDGNWQVRTSLTYGESWATLHDRSGMNGSLLSAATIDPYDTAGTVNTVINDLANYEIYSQGINTLTSGQVVADGKLFSWAGGDVHLAVGGEIRRQTLRDTSYNGPVGTTIANTGGVFPGGRTIKAGFTELFIPIVGDQNALPLVRRLSLDAAVRYDDYTDFGGTTNPRFGLDYQPIDDLTLRANFQTTFNAPSLSDDGNKVDAHLQIVPQTGDNYFVYLAGAGNNLKPTTGTSFSVGGDWSPHQIDGLKLGTTYWNSTLKNIINQALGAYGSATNALTTPYNLCGTAGTPVNGACTQAYINSLQPLWVRFDGSGSPGINSVADLMSHNILGLIDARRANFGSEKISGFDFDASYTREVSFGTVYAQAAGTYILNKEIAARAGAAYKDYLSSVAVNGRTPQYNLTGTIGVIVGPYTARVTVSQKAGFNIPAGTAVGQTKVGSFTLANLYLSADLGKLGVMNENELTLSVNNLFDQDPPYYGAVPNVGSASTTAGFTNGGTLGRMFTVGIRTKF